MRPESGPGSGISTIGAAVATKPTPRIADGSTAILRSKASDAAMRRFFSPRSRRSGSHAVPIAHGSRRRTCPADPARFGLDPVLRLLSGSDDPCPHRDIEPKLARRGARKLPSRVREVLHELGDALRVALVQFGHMSAGETAAPYPPGRMPADVDAILDESRPRGPIARRLRPRSRPWHPFREPEPPACRGRSCHLTHVVGASGRVTETGLQTLNP